MKVTEGSQYSESLSTPLARNVPCRDRVRASGQDWEHCLPFSPKPDPYIYIYIYIYIYARPPPMIHTFGLGKAGFGRGGLQTPDFQKIFGVPPDSRLQISRKNLEYLQTPDSRFPEKIWSTTRLQTPDFQKKSGVPGPWTPDSGVCNLESEAAGTPDFFWKSGVWSLGPPRTPDFFWKSGVWGRGYSRFFLEIWSLESGAPVLQIFSGNLESGVWGPGTPDFFLEIWSLESGARVLQIFSGNLESGVRGRVLQIFSGNLESGARVLQNSFGNLESGVRGPGTPNFSGNLETGVRGPCSPYARLGITV